MTFRSKIVTLFGLLIMLFGMSLLSQRFSPRKLSFDDYKTHVQNTSKAFPKKITISKLKIELPIYPAEIKDNKWDATSSGVSYLSSSPVPGDLGNSIIYGHNWANLLGPITSLKPGDVIEIELNKGIKRKFVVRYTAIVNPNQTSILNPSKDNRITLYTCAGFLDSKRFVATAFLSK